MNWWEMAVVGICTTSFGIGVIILGWWWQDRRKRKPMPPVIPPGDYVPDEWVAEYRKKNRGRP
jgi:hypothetical protein